MMKALVSLLILVIFPDSGAQFKRAQGNSPTEGTYLQMYRTIYLEQNIGSDLAILEVRLLQSKRLVRFTF